MCKRRIFYHGSRNAYQMLVVKVAILEGGMKSWSMYLEPIKVGDLDKWWRTISICTFR